MSGVQAKLVQIAGEVFNHEQSYADTHSLAKTRYRWCNTDSGLFKPGLRVEAEGPYVPSGERIDPLRLAFIVFWQIDSKRGDSYMTLCPHECEQGDGKPFDRDFLRAFMQYLNRVDPSVPAGLMPMTADDEHLEARQPMILPTRAHLPPAA